MQAWLNRVDSERPLYSEVVHKKVDDKLLKCYVDSPNIIEKMKESKKQKLTVVTFGLWPLDVVSYNDWRHSSHASKTYAEWITMARMEIFCLKEYQAWMLQECPGAVSICLGLAEALGEACNLTPWDVLDEKMGKTVKKHLARFVYVDKIPSNDKVLSEVGEVNVVKLKENWERVARAQALAKEGTGLLRKIQQFKGSLAAPGSRKLDRDMSQAIRDLRSVRCHSLPKHIRFYNLPATRR